MSWENIHVDDYGWVGKLRIVQDSVAVDISTYTTTEFVFRTPSGEEVTVTAEFSDNGSDGYLEYTIAEEVIDEVGQWQVKAVVSKTGSELTSNWHRFSVEAR